MVHTFLILVAANAAYRGVTLGCQLLGKSKTIPEFCLVNSERPSSRINVQVALGYLPRGFAFRPPIHKFLINFANGFLETSLGRVGQHACANIVRRFPKTVLAGCSRDGLNTGGETGR
jgi:hypothetical protein